MDSFGTLVWFCDTWASDTYRRCTYRSVRTHSLARGIGRRVATPNLLPACGESRTMLRRRALKSFAAVVTTAIAGCTGGGPTETSTPTPTKEPTKASPTGSNGSTVTYLVRNDDNATHPLEVVIETAAGEVVHRKSDSEVKPSEQLGATSSGHDPNKAPFPITISLQQLSQTIDWKADECPRFDLLVAVTSDGQLDVEREECIK